MVHILLDKVCKYYVLGNRKIKALDKLYLKVESGEYVAITGSSGSGKSTVMNILGALDRPSSGQYKLNGRDINELNENQLAEFRNVEVGFVFQSFNLIPRISVLANVMKPLVYRGIMLEDRMSAAKRVLERVGLRERINHYPNELSGGQQQRVAIARALVGNPSILLADEPTGNLDSTMTAEIMGLFDELHREGNTIVMVTHDPFIANHCKRIVFMRDGQIAEDYTCFRGDDGSII